MSRKITQPIVLEGILRVDGKGIWLDRWKPHVWPFDTPRWAETDSLRNLLLGCLDADQDFGRVRITIEPLPD